MKSHRNVASVVFLLSSVVRGTSTRHLLSVTHGIAGQAFQLGNWCIAGFKLGGFNLPVSRSAKHCIVQCRYHLLLIKEGILTEDEVAASGSKPPPLMRLVSPSRKKIERLTQAEFDKYVSLLRKTKALAQGKKMHTQLANGGHDRCTYLGNLLMQMYGNCGSLEDARLVLDKIRERNVFSWNIMIAAYSQNGQLHEARFMFNQMPQRDAVSWNAVVAAYAQKGLLEDGRIIFDVIPEKNVVSWTCMVAAYAENGILEDAKSFFDGMPHRNVVSWTAMVGAYAQNGYLESASSLFGEMPERNAVSWNTLITAYARCGHSKEVLKLFRVMDLEGFEPNLTTFTNVFSACASVAALTEGKLIHAEVFDSGLQLDTQAYTGLLSMYAKCGSLGDVRLVSDKMPQRDVVSWNATIAAYGQNGHSKEALEVFRVMLQEGMQPSSATFTSILSTCSHAGVLANEWVYSDFVSGDYGTSPTVDHYVCMIDLLGRAGMLDEAEKLMQRIPYDALAWRTLLGACQIHGDTERGKSAAGKVLELDPLGNSAPYVLLSNIYNCNPHEHSYGR